MDPLRGIEQNIHLLQECITEASTGKGMTIVSQLPGEEEKEVEVIPVQSLEERTIFAFRSAMMSVDALREQIQEPLDEEDTIERLSWGVQYQKLEALKETAKSARMHEQKQHGVIYYLFHRLFHSSLYKLNQELNRKIEEVEAQIDYRKHIEDGKCLVVKGPTQEGVGWKEIFEKWGRKEATVAFPFVIQNRQGEYQTASAREIFEELFDNLQSKESWGDLSWMDDNAGVQTVKEGVEKIKKSYDEKHRHWWQYIPKKTQKLVVGAPIGLNLSLTRLLKH